MGAEIYCGFENPAKHGKLSTEMDHDNETHGRNDKGPEITTTTMISAGISPPGYSGMNRKVTNIPLVLMPSEEAVFLRRTMAFLVVRLVVVHVICHCRIIADGQATSIGCCPSSPTILWKVGSSHHLSSLVTWSDRL
jgi:hypothetical protein